MTEIPILTRAIKEIDDIRDHLKTITRPNYKESLAMQQLWEARNYLKRSLDECRPKTEEPFPEFPDFCEALPPLKFVTKVEQ